MDIEPLLAPVGIDDPSGPDLAYSAERGEIERMFERAARENVDDADWRTTAETILAQGMQTKDLWLAVYLARIGAKSNDLTLVDDGCAWLAGLVERYWDSVHPTLEEYGIAGRKAPCESLVRIGEFLGPLKRVEVIAHARLGSFSGEDFTRFRREGEAAVGYGQFRAAIADTPVDQLESVTEQLRAIANALMRVDAVVSEQAATANQTGTNFEPAYETIDAIVDAIAPFISQAVASDHSAAPAPAEVSPPAAGVAGKSALKPIDSREDVARALDSVIDYYTRREPSSPIPEALRRIKGWIAMDFMAILRDISPSGVPDAERVLRVRIEESDRSDLM